MEKKTVALVVAMLVILGLAGCFYTQMMFLQFQVTSLTDEVSTMTQQINDLQNQVEEKDSQIKEHLASINQLQTQISNYETQLEKLESDYGHLQSEHEVLQREYYSLQTEYTTLEGKYNTLQQSYSELQAENERLRELLELYEKVPHSYYSVDTFSHHANTYSELSSFLTREFKLPREYKAGIFDCSESSAYLEWVLENAGFDAYIAVGPAPWDPSAGYHAWVIVYTTKYRVAIEATALTGEYKLLYLFLFRTPGVVYSEDPLIPGWENYYEGYDYLYKNIYEAVRYYHSVEEWNWWEGYWGFT